MKAIREKIKDLEKKAQAAWESGDMDLHVDLFNQIYDLENELAALN